MSNIPKIHQFRRGNIAIDGHIGTWRVIDTMDTPDGTLYLMEHEEFGDNAYNLIVDGEGSIIVEDVSNGFQDYYKARLWPDDELSEPVDVTPEYLRQNMEAARIALDVAIPGLLKRIISPVVRHELTGNTGVFAARYIAVIEDAIDAIKARSASIRSLEEKMDDRLDQADIW
jgi:hypothetical protein